MSDQAIAERVELDKKDKAELQAIVTALGGKATSRVKKADLIDSILELSGVIPAGSGSSGETADETADATAKADGGPADASPASTGTDDGAATSSDESETSSRAGSDDAAAQADPSGRTEREESESTDGGSGDSADESDDSRPEPKASGSGGDSNQGGAKAQGGGRRRRGKGRADEPPAEWEVELDDPPAGKSRNQGNARRNEGGANQGGRQSAGGQQSGGQQSGGQQSGGQQSGGQQGGGQQGNNQGNANDSDNDSDEGGNRRRRRRGRGRERDDNIEPASQEPIEVSGILDLRDDGYGFLRVSGLLPSKDDVYVPVKMARQYGLRKGDLVSGLARAANRNEKNPALQQLDTVNGSPSDDLPVRPEFEKLTPLFADERLRLERERQPLDLTVRIIDLIAPIGKGQRGLIVSPPKAGKTTIMKEIATSIEQNHPDVELIVLLLDERPEEVTDMQRHLPNSDVIASTFDRPTDEHCAVAELTIERAKRVVEEGKDVVVIVDGITRLARAYNMAASGTGRVMSGGVDAGALYPPKKFLGAARNLEEGGSLTILATALVETGSRMDEVIFEEFKGTGNMELRLDRGLAERYVFPAIDALGSSTRRDELLMDGKEHHASLKLRKVLGGMSSGDDGAAASAMNLLIDRLKTFKTNEEFLQEIARS